MTANVYSLIKGYQNLDEQLSDRSNNTETQQNDAKVTKVIIGLLFVGSLALIALGVGVFEELQTVQNTPVQSAVVTKVGDTTLQLKYPDGRQQRFFLNSANDVPQEGQTVDVKRSFSLDTNKFDVVGYDNKISTNHYGRGY